MKLGTSLFEDEDNEEDGDDKKTKEKPKLMLSSRYKKREGTYAEKKETIKEGKRRENKKSRHTHTREEYRICTSSFTFSSRFKR